MTQPVSDTSRTFPTIPRGEVIGRYENYLDAQKVVDYLADNDFPVANVSIIGNDLKLVERVRGKLSYPKVAGQGAAQGAVLGLFFGFLLMFFSSSGQTSLAPMLAAVLLGAVLFMFMAVASYAMQRGQRDFNSTRQVLPSTWDVVVDPRVSAQARQIASRLPMHPAQANVRQGWGAPTQQPPVQQPPAAPQDQPGQDPAGHYGQPGQYGQPAQPGPEGNADQPAAGTAPFQARGYEDLDDGRPRYGVRLDAPTAPVAPAQPGQASAQPGQEPPQGWAPAQPPASGSEEAEAPAAEPTPGRHAAPNDGENR